MKIKGTVTHQNIEGGFWGILGDDGERYRPIDGLPGKARKDGCRVEVDVEPANVVSFAMWGRNVKLRSLDVID